MRRLVKRIIRHRKLVILAAFLLTVGLSSRIGELRVIIDPDEMLPASHPFVMATTKAEKLFGSKYNVSIGITPKEGDIFESNVLEKVERITSRLLATPGVIKANVLSLSARKAKGIAGSADGLEARPLMPRVPRTHREIDALRATLAANPIYTDLIVSRDLRTAGVIVEFEKDEAAFRGIEAKVHAAVDPERDKDVEIRVGGIPMYLAVVERYSERMAYLFPLAVLVIGLIHYEAFRTAQGLILPLVTALLAVTWSVGIMSMAGVPLDVFNVATPILILAIAAGHAVQILHRYYEEYAILRVAGAPADLETSRRAVVESLTKVGPVMLAAGTVAALSFLSLTVFDVATIRTFGLFTALGIGCILLVEIGVTPALRAMLPPPGCRETGVERRGSVWDRVASTLGDWALVRRRRAFVGTILFLLAMGGGIHLIEIDNSVRGYFFSSLPVRQADSFLNVNLGGTNSLYVIVEGREDGAIEDPAVLEAIAATQNFLERYTEIGKTVSIADFIKRINRAMNEENPSHDALPRRRDLISQYLLLYSLSGDPGDFDSYVDFNYRSAAIVAFVKTDSSAFIEKLSRDLKEFAAEKFPPNVTVSIGGNTTTPAALNETMVRDKLLNIVQIAGVVLVVSSLMFRSVLAGLLILVPLIVTVIANFGIMGLSGIPLSISTSVTSAMAVGIGADYAIYLAFRLREELTKNGDHAVAVRRCCDTAGKAILFVAAAVAGGYAVMMLSYGYKLHIWLGILIGTAMAVSSVSALTLFLSLLLAVRPGFVFGADTSRRLPAKLGLALAAMLAIFTAPAHADEMSAIEIMERNFMVSRVAGSTLNATFRLINRSGQERIRTADVRTKLQDNKIDNMRFLRFLSPADIADTTTLLIEHPDANDDMWIYLPALKKVRRLAAANKRDSYVGTDFSYGDMIGHRVGDWRHTRLRDENVEGQACHVIESRPENTNVQSESGYSRRVNWVRKDNFVLVRSETYDESGQLLKVYRAEDIQLVDPVAGRWQPMFMEIRNVQSGHQTRLEIRNYRINPSLADEAFTTRAMEKPR